MEKIDILALNLIKGIGSKSIIKFINENYSLNDLITSSEDDLSKIIRGKYAKEAISNIKNRIDDYRVEADRLLNDLKSEGIEIITYCDKSYPIEFRKIKKPPLILYIKGNKDLLQNEKNIAIVGTRECSKNGFNIAFNTSEYFSQNEFNIVSGLAKGIDTAAHKGALESGGVTTAILVDVKNIYPKENEKLAEQILLNNGLLLAENIPGCFILGSHFVERDRLQSALSKAVFVIETDIKGGTMHTVHFAREQGKTIYCPDFRKINYPPNFDKIRGIKKLINENIAIPYTKENYEVILNALLDGIKTLVVDNINNSETKQKNSLKKEKKQKDTNTLNFDF